MFENITIARQTLLTSLCIIAHIDTVRCFHVHTQIIMRFQTFVFKTAKILCKMLRHHKLCPFKDIGTSHASQSHVDADICVFQCSTPQSCQMPAHNTTIMWPGRIL